MHRDLFGDDGLVQNTRAAGRQRGGAGGFAALEQLVRGDIEILRETAYGVGGRFILLHGDHEQFQKAYLAVEYLHTRHMHGVIALMLGGHVHHGIGQDGTVVFVQGVRAGRAGDGNVVGQCLGTGGDVFVRDSGAGTLGYGDDDVRHGLRVAGGEAAQAQKACAGKVRRGDGGGDVLSG